jgi:hypothetical protein
MSCVASRPHSKPLRNTGNTPLRCNFLRQTEGKPFVAQGDLSVCCSAWVWSCEGFRMSARTNVATCTGADVRKPPGKEPAGLGHAAVPFALWGFGGAEDDRNRSGPSARTLIGAGCQHCSARRGRNGRHREACFEDHRRRIDRSGARGLGPGARPAAMRLT